METVRRVDARRNDARIIAAAQAVFSEQGPDAPMGAIASRAGCGMSALYRRFPSKEDLMRAVTVMFMDSDGAAAEEALEVEDAWEGFAAYIRTQVEAGVGGAPYLSGRYAVTEEVIQASRRARASIQRLIERTQAEGGLRADVNAQDIITIVSDLRRQRAHHARWPEALGRRLLAIVLDGLRAPNATPLADPPLTTDDIERTWVALSHPS